MLAKRTSKNQITLPKALLKQLPEAQYFDVTLRKGSLILRPVIIHNPVSASRRWARSAPWG